MKGFLAAATSIAAVLVGTASASHSSFHEKRVDHYGRMTWFNLPEGSDACGQPIPNGLPAVHVSKDIWKDGRNCGQWMSITVNGKQSYGVVTGYCDSCTAEQIDTAPGLFSEYDHTDVGILQAKWKFMKMGWAPDYEECE